MELVATARTRSLTFHVLLREDTRTWAVTANKNRFVFKQTKTEMSVFGNVLVDNRDSQNLIIYFKRKRKAGTR